MYKNRRSVFIINVWNNANEIFKIKSVQNWKFNVKFDKLLVATRNTIS